MRPTEKIENFVKEKRSHVESDAALDKRVMADSYAAMDEAMRSAAGQMTPNIWRIIMKSKMTRFAAAAVIVIVAMVGITQLGGGLDGSSVAFAAVLENIGNARNVVFTQRSERPNSTYTSVEMVNENGVIRSELEHGTVLIFDFNNGYTLQLDAAPQQAIRTHRTGRKRREKGFSFIDWVRKLHEGEAEFIGSEELEGEAVNVYVWEVPFEKITVWTDVRSDLPVKVEHKRFANTEKNIVVPELSLSMDDFGGDENISRGSGIGSGRGSGLGISYDRTSTMYDFQWDVDLDDALFSLEPPEDYTLEERESDGSPIDENSLAYTLGFWAQMRDGDFPTEEELNDPEAFKPLLIEKYDGDGDPKEELDAAMVELDRIVRGIYVVQKKKVGGSWGYNGEDVQLGDVEGIVCWWKDDGSDSWSAIYGDLSIGEVTEEELPIGY